MAETLYTVGLGLDTQQLQQGVQTATRGLQTLGQAENTLTRQTQQTDQATQQLGRSQQRLGQSAQQATTAQKALQSGMQGLLGSFTSVQGAAGALGAYLGGQFLRSVIQTSSQMQTLQLSLDAVTGSTTAGAEAMLFARQTANQLGLASNDVADIYRGFLANTTGLNLGITTTNQLFTGSSRPQSLWAGAARRWPTRCGG